jgi:hypothetical protein
MIKGIRQKEEGKCIICGKETILKYTRVYENREKDRIHFDLCENCKSIKNCFTCRYSKCWYLRYKGNCDINFQYLILYSIFEDKDKEALEKVIKKYDLEDIDRTMKVDDFFTLIKNKQREQIERELSDCNIYKTKKIGILIKDFWEHAICKRYQKGDVTVEEWNDYYADYDWDDDRY